MSVYFLGRRRNFREEQGGAISGLGTAGTILDLN
jgi:hypothetical protein